MAQHWNWCTPRINTWQESALLFNIFVCDLFLILHNTYFVNYADDNTPYTIKENADSAAKSLQELSENNLS